MILHEEAPAGGQCGTGQTPFDRASGVTPSSSKIMCGRSRVLMCRGGASLKFAALK